MVAALIFFDGPSTLRAKLCKHKDIFQIGAFNVAFLFSLSDGLAEAGPVVFFAAFEAKLGPAFALDRFLG